MNRVIKTTALFGFAGLCTMLTASATDTAKPNILLIMADDLGYHDLATNPTELAGEKALKSPEKKVMLSKKLNAWLQKVKTDATTLTPKH
jgi:hypothetical protein